MPETAFKSYAPFGVATKRFIKVGFHPELDKSGAMKKEITKLGPSSLNPKRFVCQSKQGMNWKHKKELEEFSKYLGFRNSHVLEERQFAKTLGGPGGYDVNDELFKQQPASKKENIGFGSGPRILRNLADQGFPAPCTYMRNVTANMEPSKKSFSKLPTFEYDGIVPRFRDESKPYHLPPNLYDLNDKKNVADITTKVVSARGPYECFTGPRDGSTIKNHFSPPQHCAPDYFYIKPSDLQYMLKNPTKQRYGLFLQEQRFQPKPNLRHMLNDLSLCYRNPREPGPAHYYPGKSSIRKLPHSKYPFNSSNVNARPPKDWRISPGTGRYNPKAPRCMKLKRPSWVFLTKGDRSLFTVQSYTLFSGN